jgi:hypothetical protein
MLNDKILLRHIYKIEAKWQEYSDIRNNICSEMYTDAYVTMVTTLQEAHLI